MPILRNCGRCLLGSAIGAVPGALLAAFGDLEIGIGLAISGGVLGGLIALAPLLNQTTSSDALGGGLSLTLRVIIDYNSPFSSVGEALAPVDDRTPAPASPVLQAGVERLWDRISTGGRAGAIAMIPVAIVLGIYFPEVEDNSLTLRIMFAVFIGILLITFVGGGLGGAIGALTLPGVHRRNIVLGAAAGLAIGAGVATSMTSGFQHSRYETMAVITGILTYLGTMAGVIAGENFR